MKAYERLLKYVQYDTASDERSETCPSTAKQLVLARALVEEMNALGIQDARVDENGYVYGCVPANIEGAPVIGLIAHMDTVDCVPSSPVRPRIIENYDGNAVQLENGDWLDPKMFPEVARAKGKDLIVTDGITLLGADDKAGVAEILTMVERLNADPSIRHGKIMIGFTPDEEIGRGADRFDVAGFGADFAYTVDGSDVGTIEYENFNAASGTVIVHGLNVHPGSAKNKMRNASLVAMEFAGMLPPAETPAHTEGYEGFFHVHDMGGNETEAYASLLIRDHDRTSFEKRKAFLAALTAFENSVWGDGSFTLTVKDSYYNMKEQILPHMELIEHAQAAMRAEGVEPVLVPIRGGTDGARLSFMGLPCPNLCTGGANFHGVHEFIPVESMEKMVAVLVNLMKA